VINQLRSEWIKIRTLRVNFVLALIAALFPLIVVGLVTLLTQDEQDVADNLASLVTGTMLLTTMLLGVIGALNLTGEYSHQTIRTTFAATPQRSRVLLAKAFVTVVSAMVFAAIIEFLTYLTGSIILSGRDAEVLLDGNGKAALIGVVVLAGLLALLGYGLGLIIRNSPATVAVLILWPLLLENIARGVLGAAGVENQTPWLPYQAGLSMTFVELEPGEPSRLQGGLTLGAVVLVFVIIGLFVNERRDA